jgi:hypothetical protein
MATLLVALVAVQVSRPAGAHAAAALTCGGNWTVVSSPSSGYSTLSGVAVTSPNEVWAVGGNSVGIRSQNVVIEQWDGTNWQDVSPGVGGYLFGVTAVSSSDAWAVGRTSGDLSLVEHWNGRQWTTVPSPNDPTAQVDVLQGVAAVSPTDIWAVGYATVNVGPPQDTLIEHWNGHTWSIVSSPNGGVSDNTLTSVTAISSTDVWAVGNYFNTTTNHHALLTEHWNGRTWTIVPAPGFGSDLLFTSVTSTDASHVWAVGHSTGQGGNLIEQWNGTRWGTNVTPAGAHVFLYGVGAYSPTSAWAVGGGVTTVAEQWNGTQWTIVSSPNGPDDNSQLSAVAMDSAQSAWAVGYTYGTAPQQSSNLIERFC